MSNNVASGLTISAVAARTGMSVGALRAWEQRFGFPRPQRLPSGQRRYTEADVEALERALGERAAGRSVEAAIEAATAAPTAQAGAATVFAGLRLLRPDVEVHALSRRAMLAISLAIEDECRARADRPHLAAAFQREATYRDAEDRWAELARTAAAAIVFADFARSHRARSGVHEVGLPASVPLRREWSVICDAPGSAAVLAGWERPDGRFEALWSVDPEVVRAATSASRALARQLAPRLRLPPEPEEVWAESRTAGLRRATVLTNRIVAYLDRPSSRGPGGSRQLS